MMISALFVIMKIRNHTIKYWYIHIMNYAATKNGIIEERYKTFIMY